MTQEHTPGPWASGENPAAIESGSFSNMLVVRPEGEFPHGLWVADCGNPFDPENVANARLIAAAPELLEALKFIADYASMEPRIPSDDVVIDRARAAIAKALGQAQQEGAKG